MFGKWYVFASVIARLDRLKVPPEVVTKLRLVARQIVDFGDDVVDVDLVRGIALGSDFTAVCHREYYCGDGVGWWSRPRYGADLRPRSLTAVT